MSTRDDENLVSANDAAGNAETDAATDKAASSDGQAEAQATTQQGGQADSELGDQTLSASEKPEEAEEDGQTQAIASEQISAAQDSAQQPSYYVPGHGPSYPAAQFPLGAPVQQVYVTPQPRIDNNMGWGIGGICVFFPLGIPALLHSQKVDPLVKKGELEEAQRYADAAKKWGKAAIFVGIGLIVSFFVLYFAFIIGYIVLMIWGISSAGM